MKSLGPIALTALLSFSSPVSADTFDVLRAFSSAISPVFPDRSPPWGGYNGEITVNTTTGVLTLAPSTVTLGGLIAPRVPADDFIVPGAGLPSSLEGKVNATQPTLSEQVFTALNSQTRDDPRPPFFNWERFDRAAAMPRQVVPEHDTATMLEALFVAGLLFFALLRSPGRHRRPRGTIW